MRVTAPSRSNALIASASRLSLDDGKAARRDAGRRESWQEEAWSFFFAVPEIKFASLWIANMLSKVTFFAGYELDDGTVVPIDSEGSPIASTTLATDAVQELRRLEAARGGQALINWLGALNIEVCGEFFLWGIEAKPAVGNPGDPGFEPAVAEQWSVVSRSMVEVTAQEDASGRAIVKVKQSPDDSKPHVVDPERETLIRIYQPNPQWPALADNNLRSCLGDCETLVLLQNQQKAEAKSKQAPGLLLIPSELSFADDPPEGETDAGDPADDQDRNPFVAALMKALTEPIEDPASVNAVVPLVISAPGEHLHPDKFRLIRFDRTNEEVLDRRIEAKINRLARGLNIPVEVVMGHMSTTFSNAEQIDEDKFKDHVEPRCWMMADGLEFAYLMPNLTALGYDEVALERVRVGFDPSGVVHTASPEENAEELWDAGAISYAAYRRLKGATEDDAPDEDEFLVQLAARKGIFTSDLTTIVLQKGGVDLDAEVNADANNATIVESGQAPSDKQPADSGGDAAVTAAARRAHPNYGRRLADIDRNLRSRLQGAAEGAMSRALERAGNRLKARRGTELAASARLLPSWRAAAGMSRDALTAAGFDTDQLLEGAWDEFSQQFELWVQQAGQEALDVVSTVLGGMSTAQRDALKLRQLQDSEEAVAWIRNALDGAGEKILFNPERGALGALETVGEWDPVVRVPPGLIREALAMAGGHNGLRGAPGVLAPSNNEPVGGVATGEVVLGALRDGGAYVNGFRWTYGPGRRRTFEPHAQLDGVEFQNFDDPVLANTSGWPETAFYFPGDHNGCLCDFEPAITPAATKEK